MLELSKVRYRYPEAEFDALQALTLSLQAGDIIGLLGPNGAGKTTLFSLLSGLVKPTAGQLTRQQTDARVGLVPQHLAFYSQLSIEENLAFFADIYQLKGIQRQQQLQAVIDGCNLGSRLKQRAATLSGGWQRRLNFAIGILQPADIYLFDEATVGVDAQSRQLLLDVVKQLAATGKTLLYTSHYLQEIEHIANRILVLQQGQLLLDAPIGQLSTDTWQLMVQWPKQAPLGWLELVTNLGLMAEPLAQGYLVNLTTTEQWQQLHQFIAAGAVQPALLHYGKPSLEQLYLHVTGGQL